MQQDADILQTETEDQHDETYSEAGILSFQTEFEDSDADILPTENDCRSPDNSMYIHEITEQENSLENFSDMNEICVDDIDSFYMNETPILKVLPIHGESHPLPYNVEKVAENLSILLT